MTDCFHIPLVHWLPAVSRVSVDLAASSSASPPTECTQPTTEKKIIDQYSRTRLQQICCLITNSHEQGSQLIPLLFKVFNKLIGYNDFDCPSCFTITVFYWALLNLGMKFSELTLRRKTSANQRIKNYSIIFIFLTELN